MTYPEDLERTEAVVVDTSRGKRALVIAREAQKWLDAREAVRKEERGRTPAKPSPRKPEPRQCPLVGRAMETER